MGVRGNSLARQLSKLSTTVGRAQAVVQSMEVWLLLKTATAATVPPGTGTQELGGEDGVAGWKAIVAKRRKSVLGVEPVDGGQAGLCIVGVVGVHTVHAVGVRGPATAQHRVALHHCVATVLEGAEVVLRLHLEGGLQALLGQSTFQGQAWGSRRQGEKAANQPPHSLARSEVEDWGWNRSHSEMFPFS